MWIDFINSDLTQQRFFMDLFFKIILVATEDLSVTMNPFRPYPETLPDLLLLKKTLEKAERSCGLST